MTWVVCLGVFEAAENLIEFDCLQLSWLSWLLGHWVGAGMRSSHTVTLVDQLT
jgi:hypothetical protein